MTYIKDLDPQRHDPALDEPKQCSWCGWKGTVEDFQKVVSRDSNRYTGYQCPACHTVAWDIDYPGGSS